MSLSPTSVLAGLRATLPSRASGDLCVGFSGGLDSTVLVAVLAQARQIEPSLRLRAVHIDHQLQSRSVEWDEHCRAVANTLSVEYQSCRVQVIVDPEAGPEASARAARYEELRSLLRPGETLVTAHHADDQLETLLLALMRGAGTRGLAGMPACQPFAQGWHARPLLEFTRAQIEEWGKAHALRWIDDPTNDNSRFSRNFLRNEVVPLLRSRWPAAATTASRAAAHLAEGAELLDELAAIDCAPALIGDCLAVETLAALSPTRRRNVLRYWLRQRGVRSPSTRKLSALEHDMLAADPDRSPVVDWDGYEIRRYRGVLYANRALAQTETTPRNWDWRQPFVLPQGLGTLRTATIGGPGLSAAALPPTVRVDFRHGGEAIRPAGHDHHRTLKNLLQEADILPWWRSRVPLIWAGDRLAAVGDLWIAEEFATRDERNGVRIAWDERPQIVAVR